MTTVLTWIWNIISADDFAVLKVGASLLGL